MIDRTNFPKDKFKEFRQILIDKKIIKNNNIFLKKIYQDNKLKEQFLILLNFFSSDKELAYCLKNDILPITDDFICPVCHINYLKFVGKGWRQTCINCSPNKVPIKIQKYKITMANRTEEEKQITNEKTKKTLLERYGDENYNRLGSKSFYDNMEKKYGNKFYHNDEKIKENNLKKYGTITTLTLPEIQKKSHSKESIEKAKITREKTNLEKYNVKSPTQVKSIRQLQIDSRRNKIEQFMKDNNCTLFKDLIKQYGQGWLNLNLPKIYYNSNSYISNNYLNEIIEYSKKFHNNNYTSKKEKEVLEFIKSLGNFTILENDNNTISNRNGRFYELDIYIPDKKVAYDFDGIYWHSSLFKDKNYHKRKSDYCREDGVRLIHVFEDLWDIKREIYESIIKSSLNIYNQKIYARNCEFCKLTNKEYNDFLEKNHLFGTVNSSYRYGLKYNNEIVQVIGFGKNRFDKNNEIELHRMCSLLNTQIIGGFSKLIKHSNIKKFISYVDLSIYDAKGYLSLGFKIISKTEPGYFYYKDGIRYNRLLFQKHKLQDKLEIYDPNLSEYDNMLNNKYLKIYDSGNLKLLYNKEV